MSKYLFLFCLLGMFFTGCLEAMGFIEDAKANIGHLR